MAICVHALDTNRSVWYDTDKPNVQTRCQQLPQPPHRQSCSLGLRDWTLSGKSRRPIEGPSLLCGILCFLRRRHLGAGARNQMADITDWNLNREVDGSEHLSEEDPPSCHTRDKQKTTSNLPGQSSQVSGSLINHGSVLTTCSLPANAEWPKARCQYVPVRRPKATTSVAKMTRKTTLVRNAQIR